MTLLEYLLYNGSELVVQYAKNNIHEIKTLKDFQYIDENNHDEGSNGILTFFFFLFLYIFNLKYIFDI